MRARPAAGYQLQTQVVQKTRERVWKINHQGELIEPLRPRSEHPVSIDRHSVSSYLFVGEFTHARIARPLLPSEEHMSEANPLLQIHFPVPFDRIRASHVEPAVQ